MLQTAEPTKTTKRNYALLLLQTHRRPQLWYQRPRRPPRHSPRSLALPHRPFPLLQIGATPFSRRQGVGAMTSATLPTLREC
ncbi:hypothetical protein CI238_06387 [Colletotrichum incanum]|uniref:Uncharacterized protein n=1 Tax=Colletotrichum incanum TaxID=1573173 RepID=A0A167DC48_COLIC|nr:hypothetical protein CI238_06387 [Colletotrichum incanum]